MTTRTPFNSALVGELLRGGAALATDNAVANMVGDGTTDNLALWNSLISQYDFVVIPDGTFLFSTPMVVPRAKNVSGVVRYTPAFGTVEGAVIKGTSGQPSTIKMGNGSGDSGFGATLRNLTISGASTAGLEINWAPQVTVDNIHCREHTGSYGVYLRDTWGSEISNLSTNDSTHSAVNIYAGSNFHANNCRNWYTTNACPINIQIDGGQASTFSNLTAQVGTTGFWIRSCVDHTFNSLYTENTLLPMRIGENTSGTVRGCTFNSAFLNGPTTGHASFADRITCMDLDRAFDCTFNSIDFDGNFSAYAAVTVTFSGGGGSGAVALARVHPDGNIHSVHVLRGGTGYTSDPTVGFSGGGGTGATATAARSGDAVDSVTVTGGGSGYSSNNRVPSAIRIRGRTERCTFVSPSGRSLSGISDVFYPSVVRATGSDSNSRITIIGGKTEKQLPKNAAGNMFGVPGYDFAHYVEELTSTGTRLRWKYIPPVMDT